MKIVIGALILAFVFILSSWYFFWPIVECSYAMSWEPLLSNTIKLSLFIFGGIVFVVGFAIGVRLLI